MGIDFRSVNIAAEGLSLVICIVMIIYRLAEHRKDKDDKWFNSLIIFNALMLAGDLSDWLLGGVPGAASYYTQTAMCCFLLFLSSGLLLYSLLGWVACSVSLKTKISPWWMRLGLIFMICHSILAILNPFLKFTYIGSDNYYARGTLFWLLLIFPYIIYTLSMAVLFCYRSSLPRWDFICMMIFTCIPLVAEAVQISLGNLSCLNVTVTVGLVFTSMFVQSRKEVERERRDREKVVNENHELEEMRERQNRLIEELIEVLCGTVEAKDPYTRGHSFRVASYAREIMYRMGTDEKTLQDVYYIGLLHDIGKIRIKDDIINKKGRLTDDEFAQIKLHTVAGYQILRGVTAIPDLAVGARWHHERYDGKGYPNGLAGENIPLIARVISVADTYDAMTSNRTYHSTVAQSYAREQIERGMGTQFDPQIAKIMLDMIDEDFNYDMKQIKYDSVINILMIDDDTFMHTLVESVLKDDGYVLTFASSGEEGIEYLQDYKYDLCLLDMEMPGMNGFEVLEWIHSNIRKLKVIFLTGDKSIDVIRKCDELGAVDYVTKPVDATILKESIASVLLH